MAIWATDQYLQFDLSYKDTGYSVYYDYRNHKGYKSKHQPEGCIDVDRPLWRDLRERTMEDDNPILLLYYVRK